MTKYTADYIGREIARFTIDGYTHSEAIEMALFAARRNYRRIYPDGNFPKHLQGAGKFYKKNPVKNNFKRVILGGDKFFIDSLLMDNEISRIFIEKAGTNLVYDIYTKHVNKLTKLLEKYPELEGRFAGHVKKNPVRPLNSKPARRGQNPVRPLRPKKFDVEEHINGEWKRVGSFYDLKKAKDYAKALSKAYGRKVRITN